MIDFLKLKDFQDLIPNILNYIVPGFIFIVFRSYKLSKDISKDKYIIVKSIVFSFILMQLISLVIPKQLKIFSAVLIIISIIISIIYVRYDVEKKIILFLKLNKSTSNDYLDDIIDPKSGSWVYSYLPTEEVIYFGKIVRYETSINGADRNILISNFTVCSYDGEEIANHSNDDEWKVLLNTKNIARIELYM